MSFSSPIPERANSRLAMIGILACLFAEWNTGVGVWQQVQKAPVPIALTFLTFITASIIPSLRGVSPEKADKYDRPLRDLFSEKAEVSIPFFLLRRVQRIVLSFIVLRSLRFIVLRFIPSRAHLNSNAFADL